MFDRRLRSRAPEAARVDMEAALTCVKHYARILGLVATSAKLILGVAKGVTTKRWDRRAIWTTKISHVSGPTTTRRGEIPNGRCLGNSTPSQKPFGLPGTPCPSSPLAKREGTRWG